MSPRPSVPWQQGAVSCVIVAVLGLQAVAVAASVSKRLWPFMNYPMYKRVVYDGQVVNRFVVVGQQDNGREVILAPLDGHKSYWHFFRTFIRPVMALEDTPADTAARQQVVAYCAAYRLRYGHTLTLLRLENHASRVTRHGLEPIEPSTIGVISVPLEFANTP